MRWPINNFGDNLNTVIFERFGIYQQINFHKTNMFNQDQFTLLGIGTLLNKKLASPVTVLGSGCNGTSKPSAQCNYEFVRGKLSAQYLGLDESFGVGDPAYVLSEWIQSLAKPVVPGKVKIIPHWHSFIEGFNIIDPGLPVEEFIQEVSSCEYIYAEAMHGAICADILRRPFSPIRLQSNFDEFKWQDWGSTVGLEFEIGTLENSQFYLSSDKDLKIVTKQVSEVFSKGIENTKRKQISID